MRNIELRNLVITGGCAREKNAINKDKPKHLKADDYNSVNGGGVHVRGLRGSLILNRVTLENNIADGFGAGLYVSGNDDDDNAYLKVNDCTFWQNNAFGGGGLFTLKSHVQVRNSMIFFNEANKGAGAFIIGKTDTHFEVKFVGVDFVSNKSEFLAGAIALKYINEAKMGLNFENVRIVGNKSMKRSGAMHIVDSNIKVGKLLICKNTASVVGGAIGFARSKLTVADNGSLRVICNDVSAEVKKNTVGDLGNGCHICDGMFSHGHSSLQVEGSGKMRFSGNTLDDDAVVLEKTQKLQHMAAAELIEQKEDSEVVNVAPEVKKSVPVWKIGAVLYAGVLVYYGAKIIYYLSLPSF